MGNKRRTYSKEEKKYIIDNIVEFGYEKIMEELNIERDKLSSLVGYLRKRGHVIPNVPQIHSSKNAYLQTGLKTCTRCGVEKTINLFHEDKNSVRKSHCIKCIMDARKQKKTRKINIEGSESEIWLEVNGYELYEVSNLGRVRTKAKITKHKIDGIAHRKERYFSLRSDHEGYVNVPFTQNGSAKMFAVHRLVAITFGIPNIENKPFINHKNGVKWDNRLDNLEWSTRKENARHAIDTGLLKHSVGMAHSNSKLTDKEVLEIRDRFKPHVCGYRQLANAYNVTIYTIKDILTRKSWKHI